MVLLADEHRKRSCLAGASTWFRPVYRVSPACFRPVYRVSPTSYTKISVSAGTWYRRLNFSPVGKHLPVKTGMCRSSGGSDLLTCIITNSCVDDHIHVCNTTNFNNSSTVANGLQQATVTGFQTNGIVCCKLFCFSLIMLSISSAVKVH